MCIKDFVYFKNHIACGKIFFIILEEKNFRLL